MNQFRCSVHPDAMLVDVLEPVKTLSSGDETVGQSIRQACPACESLVLVDVVRQLHAVDRKSAEAQS